MADMHQRIRTALEFATESPVLQLGEYGFEKDTGRTKIGDGVTRWNSLPYSGKDATVEWSRVVEKPETFKPDVTDPELKESFGSPFALVPLTTAINNVPSLVWDGDNRLVLTEVHE